jgi:hypothetical protein
MASASYVSAGFLVTRPVPRPDHSAAELLPDILVSAASDIATFIPDVWAIGWCGVATADRRTAAAALGIGSDRVDALVAQVTSLIIDASRYGWPNVCYSLDAAREIARVAASDAGALTILELGLAEDQVPALLEASAPPPSLPGEAAWGEPGVGVALRRGVPMLVGGRSLGFEPLCFDQGLGCSWLCNGLEVVVARELGIRPNATGLLTDAGEARRAVAYISRDEVGAEPGLWLPWFLTEHNAV